MSYVVIDTASKLPNSPEIIAEGIALAHKYQSHLRPSGWMRAFKGTPTPLKIAIVGEQRNLDDILSRLPQTINIQSVPASYSVKYKQDREVTARKLREDYKKLIKGSLFNDLDSCLVADHLASNNGVAVHFSDTAQAAISQRKLHGLKSTGLLASIYSSHEGKFSDEPLLIADAGMQMEAEDKDLEKCMRVNAWFTIATARTLQISPKIIFGSGSNQATHTKEGYVKAHDYLKSIAKDIGIEVLGYDKTYKTLNSPATIHLDHGRYGNEFAHNVNQGILLSKILLKETILGKSRKGKLTNRAGFGALGSLHNLLNAQLKEAFLELELNTRSLNAHMGFTDSYKGNSDIDPVSIAGLILGAHDFWHVKPTYHKHVNDLEPFLGTIHSK